LIPKPNSKPFTSSNNVSPAHGATFLKRGMGSANSDMENNIQGAIAHCKQSHSADPKNMIDTSKYVQRNSSSPEGFSDGHVHGRSWSAFGGGKL
jgi:hypothetical protein